MKAELIPAPAPQPAAVLFLTQRELEFFHILSGLNVTIPRAVADSLGYSFSRADAEKMLGSLRATLKEIL